VLATADGSPINKVESNAGKLKIDQVEKAVDAEMKQRETRSMQVEGRERKRKGGRQHGSDRCVESGYGGRLPFPKEVKEAAKELKKLGVAEVGSYPAVTPIFERRESARIEQVMRNGLVAEIASNIQSQKNTIRRLTKWIRGSQLLSDI
jgi:hypothetical protein